MGGVYEYAIERGKEWAYQREIEDGDELAGTLSIGYLSWDFHTVPPMWWRILIWFHPRLHWTRYRGETIHRIGF